MDVWNVMEARHSVRTYLNRPIEADKVAAIKQAVDEVNRQSGLHIQLFVEEPEAFAAGKAHYGAFKGCRNYFALVAKDGMDEAIGYQGEALVLRAQELGLNTCWVALTYKKGKVQVQTDAGERLYMVIALGYGNTQGVPHRSKPLNKLADLPADAPQWYRDGVRAAALAPTAINQQRFHLSLREDNTVAAVCKRGPYSTVDMGIVKYHFELGAGVDSTVWHRKEDL